MRTLFPAFFCAAQLIAHRAKHLIDFAGRKGGKFGQVLFQQEHPFDFAYLFACNAAVSDHEQHFGHYRIDVASLAFDNGTHLLVYTTQQFSYIHFGRQAVQLQALQQSVCYPPECAAVILGRAIQSAVQSTLHQLHRKIDIFLAQPFQQVLLVLAAQRFETSHRIALYGTIQYLFWQLYFKIGVKQIKFE